MSSALAPGGEPRARAPSATRPCAPEGTRAWLRPTIERPERSPTTHAPLDDRIASRRRSPTERKRDEAARYDEKLAAGLGSRVPPEIDARPHPQPIEPRGMIQMKRVLLICAVAVAALAFQGWRPRRAGTSSPAAATPQVARTSAPRSCATARSPVSAARRLRSRLRPPASRSVECTNPGGNRRPRSGHGRRPWPAPPARSRRRGTASSCSRSTTDEPRAAAADSDVSERAVDRRTSST